MSIKDCLLDIVKVVNVLPFEMVKVTATKEEILLQSTVQHQSCGQVIFNAKLPNKDPDFEGIFGLSSIGMLSGITNIQYFTNDEAKVTLKKLNKNGLDIPEEIVFENPQFGKASYRLAAESTIPRQQKLVGEIKWNVVVKNPAPSKISDFSQLASIYSAQETKFGIKTDDSKLKFMIGQEGASNHKAQFVFQEDVTGDLKCDFTWNIKGVLDVLKLRNACDCEMKICNQGILEVELTTGYGTYQFMFAGSK